MPCEIHQDGKPISICDQCEKAFTDVLLKFQSENAALHRRAEAAEHNFAIEHDALVVAEAQRDAGLVRSRTAETCKYCLWLALLLIISKDDTEVPK